jgi:hypothetical protein
VYFGAGLFLTLVVVLLLMAKVFGYFAETQSLGPPASPFENVRVLPPPGQPRLQVDPRQDLAKLRAHQNELLENYAWVDQQKGIARVPIDRAMTLVLEKGLPTRTSPPGMDLGSVDGSASPAQPGARR